MIYYIIWYGWSRLWSNVRSDSWSRGKPRRDFNHHLVLSVSDAAPVQVEVVDIECWAESEYEVVRRFS
jgi:hypothetical protein